MNLCYNAGKPLHRPSACECLAAALERPLLTDRKSTRLNSSHLVISYAVFCLKKKKTINLPIYSCKNTNLDMLHRSIMARNELIERSNYVLADTYHSVLTIVSVIACS